VSTDTGAEGRWYSILDLRSVEGVAIYLSKWNRRWYRGYQRDISFVSWVVETIVLCNIKS
jgi:hypothetical protein